MNGKYKIYYIGFLLFLVFSQIWAVKPPQKTFRIMEYNVENLFDTIHQPFHEDQDFLPNSVRHWNTPRYWAKLSKLSKVIAAVSGYSPLDLIMLCEVENDSVLRDLTQRTKLHHLGYEYVMTHSLDKRGINVALLYQPMSFAVLKVDTFRIAYMPPERPTRDILYVSGRVYSGDTLDVFAVHFPSRRGGGSATKDYRCRANRRLRQEVMRVIAQRQHASVVILGDFNASYPAHSLTKGLQVHRPIAPYASDSLYVLTADMRHKNGVRGSYRLKDEWIELDQIIVNGRLLDAHQHLFTTKEAVSLIQEPFLCSPDGRGGVRPFRTYRGPIYMGGYSDHFPLFLTLYFK